MTGRDGPAQQQTVSAVITCAGRGTDWLSLRESGRYFDITIKGKWSGRVTLEVRDHNVRFAAPICLLEVFAENTDELFRLDQDADVRLWVREGDFVSGKVQLELGN